MKKNTLLLGASGRIIDVLNWKNAIVLTYFRNKKNDVVFPIEFHEEKVYSKDKSFPIPSILVLLGNKEKNFNFNSLKFNRKAIFMRDGNICQYCGSNLSKNNCTIDHVFPLSRGGTHTWRNVVACCESCNMKKGNKTYQEFEKEFGISLINKPKVPKREIVFRNYLENEKYHSWKPYLEKILD